MVLAPGQIESRLNEGALGLQMMPEEIINALRISSSSIVASHNWTTPSLDDG
jgi:hypothetical protein